MKSQVRAPWMERPTLLGKALKGLTIAIIVVLALYPFLAVVGTSLATEAEISARGGLLLVPSQPTLEAYRSMLEGGVVTRAMLVSVGVTLVGTLLSVAATVGLAYATSRPIIGGRAILFMAVFTLLFVPGIIPSFLVVKELGLLNSYASLVLPVMVSAFNLVVLRQFFMNIPGEIIDAARIDGAGDLRILTTIVLPLSKAAVAIIALFYGVAYWNAFFNALLYINDSDKWPLQLIVRQYVVNGAPLASAGAGDVLPPARAVQMAVIVTALIPILLAYPFLQRYFTRGVLSGAIKT
jgi:ABC-type glycerol-3-phosphate transport system permease component